MMKLQSSPADRRRTRSGPSFAERTPADLAALSGFRPRSESSRTNSTLRFVAAGALGNSGNLGQRVLGGLNGYSAPGKG
jgi:hypothetical protein